MTLDGNIGFKSKGLKAMASKSIKKC